MIEERIHIPFFVQCDTQVATQEGFVDQLGRAGCFQMFVGVESFNRKTLLGAHKAQNQPQLYGEIVRLCRKSRIISHFSNIIGFPDDTHSTIQEHVSVLRGLNPDAASFYVLTPIPGTQQYDEFLDAGRITESNLDRFDATCPTWRHPALNAQELHSLLLQSYRDFYSPGRVFSSVLDGLRAREISPGILPFVGMPLFTRFSVRKGMHPMSGGVGFVRADHASDYAHLRRQRYGYDLVPLPLSLELSASGCGLQSHRENRLT